AQPLEWSAFLAPPCQLSRRPDPTHGGVQPQRHEQGRRGGISSAHAFPRLDRLTELRQILRFAHPPDGACLMVLRNQLIGALYDHLHLRAIGLPKTNWRNILVLNFIHAYLIAPGDGKSAL